MAEIHSTTLLTLPDGSRVELRVVPCGTDPNGVDTDQLEEYLTALEEALNSADDEISEASSNLDDIELDTNRIAEAASEAVSDACRDAGVDKNEVENNINIATEAVLKAKRMLAKIQARLKEGTSKGE